MKLLHLVLCPWIMFQCLLVYRLSIQFSSAAQSCLTLQPHGLQHTRLLCPSLSPEVCPNLCPSNYLILCYPLLLLLPSIFPSIRVFSNKSVLRIRWPKYWSFSFSISPSMNILFPSGLTNLISLQFKELSRVFSNTTVWKYRFFSTQPSLWSNSHNCTWLLEKS